jgi:hypothetical protein
MKGRNWKQAGNSQKMLAKGGSGASEGQRFTSDVLVMRRVLRGEN